MDSYILLYASWLIGFAMLLVVAWLLSYRLHWLLLAFVFLSPTIPINVGVSLLGEAGMTITPTRIVFLLGIIATLVAITRRRILRRGFPLALPFALFLGVRFLGLYAAPDRMGGLILFLGEYAFMTALLSYLAYSLCRTRSQIEDLVTTLLVAMILVSCIGLWEWLTGIDFQSTTFIAQFRVGDAIQKELSLKAVGLARITATLSHSLILAGLIAFLWPMILQRAILNRSVARNTYLFSLMILGAALILTWGRVALLVTVLNTIAVLLVYRRKALAWQLSIMILFTAVVILMFYVRYQVYDKTLLLPVSQFAEQIDRYPRLFVDFINNPLAFLVGFGFSRFDLSGFSESGRLSWYWSVIDSDSVRIMATSGILGWITWIGLFVVFYGKVWEFRNRVGWLRVNTPIYPIALGIAGALVTALPNVSILTYPQAWPIIGIFMGAALGIMPDIYRIFGHFDASRIQESFLPAECVNNNET